MKKLIAGILGTIIVVAAIGVVAYIAYKSGIINAPEPGSWIDTIIQELKATWNTITS